MVVKSSDTTVRTTLLPFPSILPFRLVSPPRFPLDTRELRLFARSQVDDCPPSSSFPLSGRIRGPSPAPDILLFERTLLFQGLILFFPTRRHLNPLPLL